METLAIILIAFLIIVEIYCSACFYYYMKWCIAKRTEARREASRPRIYHEVRRRWTIERNRKDLWSRIKK